MVTFLYFLAFRCLCSKIVGTFQKEMISDIFQKGKITKLRRMLFEIKMSKTEKSKTIYP